jgi:uncharacterized protein (DUF1330 family)
VRRVAVFDLRAADLTLFNSYEAQVLPLLDRYGGRLESRLRAVDSSAEIHILFFPSDAAYEQYRADPVRVAAQEIWRACGASVTSYEVAPVLMAPEA